MGGYLLGPLQRRGSQLLRLDHFGAVWCHIHLQQQQQQRHLSHEALDDVRARRLLEEPWLRVAATD